MLRALEMLAFLGKKGENMQSFSFVNTSRVNHITISTDIAFIERKLGIKIPQSDIERILKKLGFEVTFSGEKFDVVVPSWRATKDISIKEDIAEEIGRIYGYDKIPEQPIVDAFEIVEKNQNIVLKNAVVDYFVSKEMYEAYNYSFSSLEKDQKA